MQHRPWQTIYYQLTTLVAVALLLLILFVSVGYFFFVEAPEIAPQPNKRLVDLQTNQALWESSRPASFEYVVERVCFCSPDYTRPYVATERSGFRTARYASQDADVLGQSPFPPDVVWLDDLFKMIADAVDEAETLDVVYDTEFGFPTRLAIDVSTDSVDEEVRFYVRDFSPVAHDPG